MDGSPVTTRRKQGFSPILAWIGLGVLSAILHFLAMEKMQWRIMINTKTVKAMTLVEFMGAHPWIPMSYLIIGLIFLLFSWQRLHPSWATWLSFLAFSSPVALYMSICSYLANKIIVG